MPEPRRGRSHRVAGFCGRGQGMAQSPAVSRLDGQGSEPGLDRPGPARCLALARGEVQDSSPGISAYEAGHQDGRLDVHLPAVSLPPAAELEIGVDAPPELELALAVGAERRQPFPDPDRARGPTGDSGWWSGKLNRLRFGEGLADARCDTR